MALASRIYGGYHKNMGRETFIAPVDWSGEWPVVSPGTGRIEWEYPAPRLPACSFAEHDHDDFNALCWNTLGTPAEDSFAIKDGTLTLRAAQDWLVPDDLPRAAAPNGCPGFYARRQQHMDFTASVTVRLDGMGEAGILLLQNGFNHLRVSLHRTEKGCVVRAVRCEKCGKPDYQNPNPATHPRMVDILWEAPLEGTTCQVAIAARGQAHALLVNGTPVATADGGFLGSETAGGFVGAYVGCFVSGEGAKASFRDFRYTGK